MRLDWLRRHGLGLGAVLLASALWAQAPPSQPLNTVAANLDQHYNSLRTWQADFTQTYTAGLTSRTESGHLYLQKPGRMRWDYDVPQAKLFLVNGNHIWQYAAGDTEATETDLRSTDDLRTPLRYLLGHTDLRRELQGLSYSGLEPWLAGDVVIQGTPPAREAGTWRQVWIEITPGYEIDRLVISAEDGSRNDIRLSKIKSNVPLSPALFQFVPPPGVKVVPGG